MVVSAEMVWLTSPILMFSSSSRPPCDSGRGGADLRCHTRVWTADVDIADLVDEVLVAAGVGLANDQIAVHAMLARISAYAIFAS